MVRNCLFMVVVVVVVVVAVVTFAAIYGYSYPAYFEPSLVAVALVRHWGGSLNKGVCGSCATHYHPSFEKPPC